MLISLSLVTGLGLSLVSLAKEVATLSAMMKVPHSVAFSPDGKRLAIGSGGIETVALFCTQTSDPVLTFAGTGELFKQTAFSPDGLHLGSQNAGAGWEGILHLWRAPSFEDIEAAEKAKKR